jgi:hypothetical protein
MTKFNRLKTFGQTIARNTPIDCMSKIQSFLFSGLLYLVYSNTELIYRYSNVGWLINGEFEGV